MPPDREAPVQQPDDDEKAATKHKRSRKGCVRCRYLKKKCDEGTPCARCSLSDNACQYYRPPPYPYMPPTGRGSAPTSVVMSAGGGAAGVVFGSPVAWGATQQQQQQQEQELQHSQPSPPDGTGWDARRIAAQHASADSAWIGQALPSRSPGAAGASRQSNLAPSPPSHDETADLFPMDLSWQSSISALCSIGKGKANEFDFIGGGGFLESPGPWPVHSQHVQPQLPPQGERFTELEHPLHQPPLEPPVPVTVPAPPPRPAPSSTTPPAFQSYPEPPLDHGVEVPRIPYLFAGSLGPRALPDGSDNELISYFQNVTTKTIVAIDDAANNPYRTTFLSLWRPPRLPPSTPDVNSALLHALFCVSAAHSSNLARARMLRGELDLEDCPDFASRARLHRSQALRVLREAAKARSLLANGGGDDAGDDSSASGSSPPARDDGEKEKRDELEVTSAAVMLLVVQSVLEGDSKLVPLLLQNAESYIRRLSLERLTPSTINLMMLHSVYTSVDHIVRGKSLVGVKLLWADVEENQAGLVKATMGISRSMLELWGRAHSLIVRQREITTLLSRQDGGTHDELRWEAAELQAELDTLEGELADDEQWYARWIRPEGAARVRLGHEFFRAAVRTYILRAGFGLASRDTRVQVCVKSVVKLTRETPVGSEVGLSWPLLICGCEALGQDREDLLFFVKRCQWKGSAPPLRVEQVLMGAWNEGRTWSETLEAVGFPLIL